MESEGRGKGKEGIRRIRFHFGIVGQKLMISRRENERFLTLLRDAGRILLIDG